MASWTLMCKAGTSNQQTIGILLDTPTGEWIANGTSASSISTKTRSGKFTFKVSPEQGAHLKKPDTGEVAAVVSAISANSTVGVTGRGRVHKSATNFTWTLQSH